MLSNSDHATLIPIKKMNRALKFYTEVLGGKLVMRGEGDMKNSFAAVKVGKASFWLIEPERHEKMELSYNAFLVKGIKRVVRGLEKKGAKFLPGEEMGPGSKVDGPIVTESWGAKSAFFKDSEGNLLMLFEQS
jgi:catechol 2,3-dioxygenase-like lactoylglutathione lyase family enzyme